MKLQEAINDFQKKHEAYRNKICEGNYFGENSKSDEKGAFDNIVHALLNGHIEVKHGNVTVQKIRPTCVEIYYHEELAQKFPEQDKQYTEKELDDFSNKIKESLDAMYSGEKKPEGHLIHDFIVYHRNKPFTAEVPLFGKTAVLNNHQSGIDIAFEFSPEEMINRQKINVRASALIRGFYRFDTQTVDDHSTHIYDCLYPYSPITDEGMQIKWTDDDPTADLEIEPMKRQNVFQYEVCAEADKDWKKELLNKKPSQRRKTLDYAIKKEIGRTKSNKPIFKEDKRELRFYNTEFYDANSPNRIYLSPWLEKDFPAFTKRLTQTLDELKLKYDWLPHTKDYWCRDFMPIQVNSLRFIQYKYWPDYLLEEHSDKYYITDCTPILREMRIDSISTDIILDGGNVVIADDRVIMTEKIFCENPGYDREKLISELEKLFQKKLLLLPWDREERYGHSDGIVRPVRKGEVLMTNYSDYDKDLAREMEKRLSAVFTVHKLSYDVKEPDERNWAYINFLEAEDCIILPALGIEEDEQALSQFKRLFPDKRIRQVLMPEIIQKGGALNCITWTLRKD